MSEVFHSGRWRGHYVYASNAVRHRMELDLAFAAGRVRGDGNDGIGRFTVDGTYDDASRDVRWRKSYVGAHVVHYVGSSAGRGIAGAWEISPGWSGAFRIWPAGASEGEASKAREAIAVPVRRPRPPA